MTRIAIIGLSCLFPGADTPDAFWEALAAARDTTSEATHEQLGTDPAVFHDPDRRRLDTSYFLRGGYVRDFVFDPEGYRLPASAISGLDRVYQWSLHVARGALVDSGHLNGKDLPRTGVILGNLSFPTRHSIRLFAPIYQTLLDAALGDLLDVDVQLPGLSLDTPSMLADGFSPGYPAAVIAAALGLTGPHFALDAACASSLYALELACMMLRAGKADLMLAGAVSAADPLFVNLGFAHLGGYPAQGQASRPLDETSGGLVAGEGAGMFVLKRYDDALRDGDHIYALVGGVGLSNDGRGKHVLTPNSKGQVLAIRRAFEDGHYRPGEVDYVECHASGTTVGDRTELNSMEQFFGGSETPLIGSVKSNLGHLLTTAGMASMTKLILGMVHRAIPATINNQSPMTSQKGVYDGSQIVAQLTDWPASNKHPRRAGVNAFGFGGVSAHVILEANESQPVTQTQSRPTSSTARMAITGMGAHFGGLSGIDTFAVALYDGQTAFTPLPEGRWKGMHHHPGLLEGFGLRGGKAPDGAYIGGFELDFMKYGIPPNPDEEPIPQQLLLLEVADQAIRDANLPAGGNVAVLVAVGTELALHQVRGRADLNWQIKAALQESGIQLGAEQTATLERITKDALLTPAQVNHYTSYIGNLAASRIAALWDFNGPAFTISAEENSVFKALEVAGLLLGEGKVDAVVVGAVDLAGSMESVLMRNRLGAIHQGDPAAGIDEKATGWMVGEGAGAVVVRPAASADSQNAYAIIDALAFAQDAPAEGELPANGKLPASPSADVVERAAHDALTAAGITPDQVGYLEMHASGFAHEDRAEIAGLTAIYNGNSPVTAFGAVKANIGHTFAASGMASLIKAALCLKRRFIPAIPNWSAPEQPQLWEDTSLWAATQSRAWLDPRLVAAISSLSMDGTAAHLVLSGVNAPVQDHTYRHRGTPVLFPLAGDDAAAILAKLDELRARVEADEDLNTLASEVYADYSAAPNTRYTLAILGRNHSEVIKQIDAAVEGVPGALADGGTWSTPLGSFFTAAPVGRDGHVAFVYPGAFNSYPKLGYDLFHLFPRIYDNLKAVRADVGDAVREDLLYPRTLAKPGPKDTRRMKEALGDDPAAMSETGLAFALLYSRVMQDYFKIEPGAAFGYSLGEGSMMWGMGVWDDGDAGSKALRSSPLFRQRIAGRMDAIRENWGIPADTPTDEFWAAYFIAAPAEKVREVVAGESKVYVTHVNTPNEVMIAGDPAACERVVAAAGGESMRAPFAVAIHTEAMESEYSEFHHLHNLPVNPVAGVRFYSAANYEPVALEREAIASSIARMACSQVDFPRLVERAYADGARVFIELGPRSTCARWIDETLTTRPHVAVSIDNMGVDDRTSLLRMLAQLVSHRVPLDLSAMYPPEARPAARRSLIRQVRPGGQDIYAAIVNEETMTKLEESRATVPASAGQTASTQPVASASDDRATALSGDLSRVHSDFLKTRQSALRQMSELIQQQITDGDNVVAAPMPPATMAATAPELAPEVTALKPPPPPNPAPAPSDVQGITPMYNHEKVETFAIGRVADCYGDKYTIYDNRRAPRIPNGPLLLVSRAVDISGERFVSKPGTRIHAEYDVPVDAWFYEENPYPTMPYSVYMEIALQPSGFLSAHHGPTLNFPEIDFYFRNLDGHGVLHHDRDMRGRTITNYVTLTNSTIMSDTIIQSFTFAMHDGDLLFYEGAATFGYFTKAALTSQAGLDAGKQVPRWIDTINPSDYRIVTIDPHQPFGSGYLRLSDPDSKLTLTDEIKVVPDGGTHGKGYAYANTIINPASWFFKAHFYQDPVMPGSIGVETIMQALQAYAIETGLGGEFENPHFAQTGGSHQTTWRYRGQILSDSEKSHVEANIKEIRREPGAITILADASLWRDKLRIYHISDIALTIVDG